MHRIAWQPRTRAAKLQQILSQRLQLWRDAWLPPSHDPLRAVLAPHQAADADAEALSLEGKQGRTWLHASSALVDRLGEACLSLDALSAPDLAEEMGTRATHALHSILHSGSHPPTDTPKSVSRPGDAGQLRHGALCFLVDGLPEPVRLTMDGTWCRTHAGVDPLPTQADLLTRQQALAATAVDVTGEIALGDISLLDSLSWSVGDVLVTDAPRDSNARLMVGSTAFATARLVPQAERHTLILD